jgi:hypothetical protein
MNEHWKTQDRPCAPCTTCGTELYEKFWGGGGWAPTDKATDKAHHPEDCVVRLVAMRSEKGVLISALVGALLEAERSGNGNSCDGCPTCVWEQSVARHDADCPIDAALTLAGLGTPEKRDAERERRSEAPIKTRPDFNADDSEAITMAEEFLKQRPDEEPPADDAERERRAKP